MTSLFTEQFTGLYATPELVGRDDVLKDFERILRDSSKTPKLVFLFGEGGMGKTRLLKKAIEMASALPKARVAQDVLDFYHITLHTPIGLADAVFETLTPPFDCFQAYQSASQALNRARLSGNVVELDQLRADAVDKFDQDLKKLSASHRIVIALDTIERAAYGLPGWMDEIPLAESWNWLVERLPGWKNVVVFVAGRREAFPAIKRMETQSAVSVEQIEVQPFDRVESLEYFDNIAQLAEDKKDYHLAQRLKNLPLDFKVGAHIYSQGRPILLSLLIDYLGFPGESDVLDMLRQTPPEKVNKEDQQHFEAALFDRLRQGELGETLIGLGRVPKGADPALLATLLGVSIPEARKRLESVKSLSVIKIRPEDQRVFLHDEMYALLQRQVYDWPSDAIPQNKAFDAIKEYYRQQRHEISQQLNEIYAPVEEQGRESLDLRALGEIHARYQALLTEIMYYFLRQDLGRGFRAYYRFSHEAIMARDISMDLQLQAELLSYLSRPPALVIEKDISVEMILANLKVRPLARAWALGQYKQEIEPAHTFIKSVEKEWSSRFPGLLAAAFVWVASLNIMRGTLDDMIEAQIHLETVFSLLPGEEIARPFDDPVYPDTVLWHKKAVCAQAHRVHGYLKRVQGFMQNAVDEYRNSAVILREIDLRIEMATTKNDMGFAQAELGEWYDGRANVTHALQLRRELGPRVPVALSLNTLAAIDIREGQYASARQNSERARSIFRAFSHKRGIGMALTTLSEAMRRLAGATPLISEDESIKLLREARDCARGASILFDEISEISRQVEALIELGCACRDWVGLLKRTSRLGADNKRLFNESKGSLEQAAELAKINNLVYRYVDALVNLTWLSFYMLETEEVVNEDHGIYAQITKTEDAFPDEAELENQPQVWAQKGKLYILKGHLAYRRFLQKRKDVPKGIPPEIQKDIEEIAIAYASALDYNRHFALNYQGIRQSKDGIFERLNLLNAAEMRIICDKIRSLYSNGSVIETFLTNRALWQTG